MIYSVLIHDWTGCLLTFLLQSWEHHPRPGTPLGTKASLATEMSVHWPTSIWSVHISATSRVTPGHNPHAFNWAKSKTKGAIISDCAWCHPCHLSLAETNDYKGFQASPYPTHFFRRSLWDWLRYGLAYEVLLCEGWVAKVWIWTP